MTSHFQVVGNFDLIGEINISAESHIYMNLMQFHSSHSSKAHHNNENAVREELALFTPLLDYSLRPP